MQHAFLSFTCRCFARLQRCFVRLKCQSSQLHIFMKELSYVFTQYFVSCVHVHFYFSPPLIFTLLAASISHLSLPLWSSMFISLFSLTRSSSFSVIHAGVYFKNNAKKDTTLFCCFSKRPGSHVISFQIKPWVAILVVWVILHWYACGVERLSLARSLSVWSCDYQIFFDG